MRCDQHVAASFIDRLDGSINDCQLSSLDIDVNQVDLVLRYVANHFIERESRHFDVFTRDASIVAAKPLVGIC